MYVANTDEELEYAYEQVEKELLEVKKKIKLEVHGVGVAASTLGSLEALLVFLK